MRPECEQVIADGSDHLVEITVRPNERAECVGVEPSGAIPKPEVVGQRRPRVALDAVEPDDVLGVSVDVPRRSQETIVVVDGVAPEARPEQCAGTTDPPVEVGGVGRLQCLHGGGRIVAEVGACEQVEVIRHQRVRVDPQAVAERHLPEELDEHLTIRIARRDVMAVDPPIHDVVTLR